MTDILDQKVHTPVGETPVVPVLLMALGAYLTWFGVHYWRSDEKWPTGPLKAVLTGNAIPEPDHATLKPALDAIVAGGGGASASLDPGGPEAAKGHTTLSQSQIEKLWTDNGGAASKAKLAGAIGMAESSGRTWITSNNPDGGTNVGIWQLDTKGKGAGHTIEQLQSPTTNARVTIMATVNGTNWNAWAAYTKGAYKEFFK